MINIAEDSLGEEEVAEVEKVVYPWSNYPITQELSVQFRILEQVGKNVFTIQFYPLGHGKYVPRGTYTPEYTGDWLTALNHLTPLVEPYYQNWKPKNIGGKVHVQFLPASMELIRESLVQK